MKYKATSVVISAILAGLMLSSCASDATTKAGTGNRQMTPPMVAYSGQPDNGFIQPVAPSPSAKPYKNLPNMGNDKHRMPFYHPAQRNRVVRTTAYTHSESDHIGYGARNAIGTTLKYTTKVRSAAADWSVYPLGTKFQIKGQPYTYVVDDYGSALVGTGTIDIYQPNKQLMRSWGRKYVEIYVLEWGNPQASLDVLAARRGYSHCRNMYTRLEQQASKGLFAKR